MATSGSYNFTVNRDDIIKAALRKIGVLRRGFNLSAEDVNEASQALNLIAKQWAGTPDMAPGFKMWTRKRGTLFLQKDTYEYTLGPTGDHATTSYAETTLTAAASSGAGSLTVNSITGISNADNIGIVLDSGSIQWTTVNGAPSGSTVTLTDTLTGDAGIGKKVYAYTNKIQLPLEIITMTLRDENGDDTAINPMVVAEYDYLADKDAEGDPDRYYYERGLSTGALFFNTAITEADSVVKFTYLRPIEDFDVAADTPDFPEIYFRPLVYCLGRDLAPEYGKTLSEAFISALNEAMLFARNQDPEEIVQYFEPERTDV